jgi:hypothetical protein
VSRVVQQRATLLALIDAFRFVAVVALVMAPVALMLRSQTPRAQPPRAVGP